MQKAGSVFADAFVTCAVLSNEARDHIGYGPDGRVTRDSAVSSFSIRQSLADMEVLCSVNAIRKRKIFR